MTDNVNLKSEINTLKNDVEKLFTCFGEIRGEDLQQLKNTCLTLSVDIDVLNDLIFQVEHLLKAKDSKTKYLMHWVQGLYQSFEQNITFCQLDNEQTQLFTAAQKTTGKSTEALSEIFFYVKKKTSNQKFSTSYKKPYSQTPYSQKPYSQAPSNKPSQHELPEAHPKQLKPVRSPFFVFMIIVVGLVLAAFVMFTLYQLKEPMLIESEPEPKLTSVSNKKPLAEIEKGDDHSKLNAFSSKTLMSSLTVSVTPADAKVHIVNTPQTYQSGILLPYNTYTLQITAKGYESLNTEITLADKTHHIDVVLRKKLPPAITQLENSLINLPEGLFTFLIQDNNKIKQQHYLEAYEMMSTEVTFAMWDACYQQQACSHLPNDYGWGRGEQPVIDVSFNDIVQQFIPWLNKTTWHTFTLPTETQWEYAAHLSQRKAYVWGDFIAENYANCANCGSNWDNKSTAPVKSFAPSQQGFYDLNGNVWEFTQDCWSERLIKPQSNGAAFVSAQCHSSVIKGGSYMAKGTHSKIISRDRVGRNIRGKSIGFRLVKVL